MHCHFSGVEFGVGIWRDKVRGWVDASMDHKAAIDWFIGLPRFEGDVGEKIKWDGPEVFWDEMELSLFGEIRREFVSVEPAAPSAGGGNELGVRQLVGMDMIEEAAVDELLRLDGFAAISLREMIREA